MAGRCGMEGFPLRPITPVSVRRRDREGMEWRSTGAAPGILVRHKDLPQGLVVGNARISQSAGRGLDEVARAYGAEEVPRLHRRSG